MKINSTNKNSLLIINLIKNEKGDIFKMQSTFSSNNLNSELEKKDLNKKPKLVASINGKNSDDLEFIPPNVRIYGFKKIIKVSKTIIEQAKLINFNSIIENINKEDLIIEPFIVVLENDSAGFISYSRSGDDITYLRWTNLDTYFNNENIHPALISDCFSFATNSFFNNEIIDDNFAFKLLVYLNYGEISEKFIPSKEKRKIGSLTTLTNDSALDIIYANSLWKINLQVGEFSVRGHFRMQPIGIGRINKRLIWIEEFKKKGYNLKAGMTRKNRER